MLDWNGRLSREARHEMAWPQNATDRAKARHRNRRHLGDLPIDDRTPLLVPSSLRHLLLHIDRLYRTSWSAGRPRFVNMRPKQTTAKLGSLLRKSVWANTANTRLWLVVARLQEMMALKRRRQLVQQVGPTVTVPLLEYELVLDIANSMHDLLMFESMGQGRYYEHETTLLLMQKLKPGDFFVDVGANNGYYSLLASSLVGPGGHVFSFEPNPSSYQRLLNNLRHNSVTNVTPFNAALTDIQGDALLYFHRSRDGQNTMVRESESSVRVRTMRLDDVVSGKSPNIVKIDVEGAEVLVLRGMAGILNSQKDLGLIVEWARESPALETLWETLTERFQVYLIGVGSDQRSYQIYPISGMDELPGLCNLWCVRRQ